MAVNNDRFRVSRVRRRCFEHSLCFLMVVGVFAGQTRTSAAILGNHQLVIDLTDAKDLRDKATWTPESMNITSEGLGWDGENQSNRDFRLLTKPLGIGTSWRPTTGANITVTLSPEARTVKLPNGQVSHERIGSVYVRYSADQKYWSTWQSVNLSSKSKAHAQEHHRLKKTGAPFLRSFTTSIQVPQLARQKYSQLWSEYTRSDVPWKSDEEAFVRKCVTEDPEFFAKEIPFVGYVQFLVEAPLSGGLRLQNFKADIGWAVGGLQAIPKDPAIKKDRDGAWRFVAR